MLLSILIYLLITYNVVTDFFLVRRIQRDGYDPSRMDYVMVCLTGAIGIWYFSLFPITMKQHVFEGIANAILGLACISMTLWALTVFRLRKKGF